MALANGSGIPPARTTLADETPAKRAVLPRATSMPSLTDLGSVFGVAAGRLPGIDELGGMQPPALPPASRALAPETPAKGAAADDDDDLVLPETPAVQR